jgi:hypothetical protein
MPSVTKWTALGALSALSLAALARSNADDTRPKVKTTLEIMSLEKEDCSLNLSWPWGGLAANHVMFENPTGPVRAIVESSRGGIRVSFDGWSKDRFVASAARVRIVYCVGGRREIDFVAEPISGGTVRVRPVGRPASEGTRIVIRLGESAPKATASVSVGASKN